MNLDSAFRPGVGLLCLVLVAGCTLGSGKRGGRGGMSSGTVDTEGREVPNCDSASAMLGEDGGFAVDSFDFTFEWSNEAGLSVGPVYTFDLQPDVTGVSATVVKSGKRTGFAFWGLNDDVFIDATISDEAPGGWWSEPYYHWGVLGGTVAMPITPGTLPDGGGCLFVQPASLQDLEGEDGVLKMVTRRADAGRGTIDVNVVVVGSTRLYQEDLDAALARMDEVWSDGGGPALGNVALFSISGDRYLRYADSNDIRKSNLPDANPQALNLFFIDDYADESGTLGEAGGIPGPLGLPGVDGAGVIVALDGHRDRSGALDITIMGETMAHEAGHQVGLFHTTESDGSRTESLSDTPDCPRSQDQNGDRYFSAAECRDYDGTNFMFWVSGGFTQDDVSPSQAQVLSRSVIAH